MGTKIIVKSPVNYNGKFEYNEEELDIISLSCSRTTFNNMLKGSMRGVIAEAIVDHDNPEIVDIQYNLVEDFSSLEYNDEDECIEIPNKNKRLINGFLRKGREIIQGTFRYNSVRTVTLALSGEKLEFYQDIGVLEELNGKDSVTPSNFDNVFIKAKLGDASKTGIIQSYSYPDIARYYEADTHNPVYNNVLSVYNNRRKELKVSNNAKMLWRLLGGKTFGIEYEVARGNINTAYLGWLGLVPVLDGSIGTDFFQEYPTVILDSPQDLHTIKEQCEVLSRHCLVDHRCALHLHIGNISKKKRKNVVSIFTLAFRLQEEMFGIVHPYKRDEIGTLQKPKNYSRPLIDLGMDQWKHLAKETQDSLFKAPYNMIYEYFTTMDRADEDIEKPTNKPWNRKWHCPTRYQWFNMLNYMMNSGTIEIRLMSPTTRYEVVLPWLIINTLIIRYAETYADKVIAHHDKITLVDVIESARDNFGQDPDNSYYHKLADYLLRWVDLRKKRYRRVLIDINKGLVNGDTAQYPKRIGQNAIAELSNDGSIKLNELYLNFDPETKKEYIV